MRIENPILKKLMEEIKREREKNLSFEKPKEGLEKENLEKIKENISLRREEQKEEKVIDLSSYSYLKNKDPKKFINEFLNFYESKGLVVKHWSRGWLILCPFHNDTDPSLGIFKDGGCYCFGCINEQTNEYGKFYKLSAVYKAYGFWPGEVKEPELKPSFQEEKENWRVVGQEQYLYTDGERTFIRVRIDYENVQTRERNKSFYFYQPVFKDGEEKLELVRGYVPLILYRLFEIRDKETVFFVEGEKCANALWELGLPATTLPIGGKVKINRELIKALLPLQGKTIYVLPDNDDVGWEYAKTIQQALTVLDVKAQIVSVPMLWNKSDVADFIELEKLKGKSNEEIKEEILSWIKKKEKVISFWEAMQQEKEKGLDRFLIPALFPARGLGLLVGRSKLGKTELLCLIVSKLLKGEPLFGRPSQKIKILWLTQEDTKVSIGTRLLLRGVTPEELQTNLFTQEIEEGALISKDALIQEAKDKGVQIVIVEPLLAIKELAELGIKDKLNYGAVYGVLLPLKKLAEKEGIFVLGVHHSIKGKAIFKDWVDVIEGVMGSTAFSGVPDCIIGIGLTFGGGDKLRRVLGKGRGVMVDYLVEWEWKEITTSKGTIRFGGYFERGEYTSEVDLTPEQRRLVEAVKELGEEATPKNIARYLDKKEGAVKMMLLELEDKGVLVKIKRGVYSINKQKKTDFTDFVDLADLADLADFSDFDLHSQPKSVLESDFQSLEKSGLEAKVSKVRKVSMRSKNFSQDTFSLSPSQSEEKSFWRVRIVNTICPKCGCNEWRVGVNPKENEEVFVFGRCLNCGFERAVGLKDFEIIEDIPVDDIPF